MATQEKKMAAALAAVSAFMQQEEEALRAAITAASEPPTAKCGPPLNVWGQSGRQAMMQMRNLMQLKALHRF
jgi:hypothetical protein